MWNFEPVGSIPYKDPKKPISQAGIKMGLSVTLDAHSDLLTEFSITSDFQGFTALVSPKTDFTLTFQQGFDVTPGILQHNISFFCKLIYGRQSAIRSQISENLPPANTLTVLQTYRQAFLIPQLTLIFVNL